MAFNDNPNKKVVRENWNTPLLHWLYEKWGKKYIYFGLPGPAAIDITLWQEMIGNVIAFELEKDSGDDPRADITELQRVLTFLNIPSTVFIGPMEEIVLRGSDYDGKDFKPDKFVTLFNLDFCDTITSKVVTKDGKKGLRFEALREIIAMQRRLWRVTGERRFVMLITFRDAFDKKTITDTLSAQDIPEVASSFYQKEIERENLPEGNNCGNRPDVLKTFFHTAFREYLKGSNIASVFLPPVAYLGGRTMGTPMLQLAVVCRMGDEADVSPKCYQSAKEFYRIKLLRAERGHIVADDKTAFGERVVTSPSDFLENYKFIRQ